MRRRIGPGFGVLSCALALLAPVRPARAQPEPVPPPLLPTGSPPALSVEALAGVPPPRPRLSLAVGMGATLDATGFTDGTHAIPSFFATGGFGDGLLGFDLGAFASSASGRFGMDQAPVDRLALDAFGVGRPAARVRRASTRYGIRVLHTLAVELGFGVERDGRTTGSGSRFLIHTGARIELPLAPAGQASELRLRLAVRHAIGLYTPELAGGSGSSATTLVGDSTELYSALVLVF